ncbi:MAG: MFS transporter, partial [Verrucomicrobiae bacterium]|nr:MFS transporter [Verrucomicrobiae bacterium]
YGILPEIVEEEQLVKANGLLELVTVMAILTGFVGGAMMIDTMPVLACYIVLFITFGVSLSFNARMSKTPEHPQVKPGRSVDEFFANLGDLFLGPRLFRILCGTGLFWFCAAVMKMNFQPWGLGFVQLAERDNSLAYINTRISLYLVWLTVGIVLGAFIVGRLHRVRDLRFVRLYGWALATLILVLGAAEPVYETGYVKSDSAIVVLLVGIGVVAGCFLIPLNATLQSESPRTRLGKTIAAQNFIDNIAMLVAGTLVFCANRAGIRPSEIFLFLGVLVAITVTVLKFPQSTDETVTKQVTPEI